MARRENASGPGSRALVVDLIRSAGPISRAELTERTGLTQPSISNIVRRLLDDGVVRESGTRGDTGGKPRTLLTINSRATVAFGVDVEGGRIVCVATDTRGGVFGRQLVDAPESATEPLASRVAALYRDVRDGLAVDESSVAGLAIVGPGPTSPLPGRSGAQVTPGWHGAELGLAVRELVDVPVHLDLDAAAAAVGEYWSRGISRDATFGCIHLGSSIGVGILTQGSLFRGASSNAGALGHVCVEPEGRPCPCGARGCLQQYASTQAVVEGARADARFVEELGLEAQDDENHVFDVLTRAAVQGHPGAMGHVTAAANRVAQALVDLTNIVDLDHVVLTGPGVAVAGSIYVRAARDALTRLAVARGSHGVLVELSSHPRDAAAVGAASVVLQSVIAPGHGSRLAFPDLHASAAIR